MTVVFTAQNSKSIVMSVDSAVTREFSDTTEYDTDRKSYFYPGVGCVTTWGAREANQIGQHLDSNSVTDSEYDIAALADSVRRYLFEEYRPHEMELSEVGYHVAGFDSEAQPHLWRVCYQPHYASPEASPEHIYEFSEHPLLGNRANYHYNGRNDLADVLVRLFISELKKDAAVSYDPSSPVGLVKLADFVVRFAAEITPEVGPPFFIQAMGSDNQGFRFRNDALSPLDPDLIASELSNLGLLQE